MISRAASSTAPAAPSPLAPTSIVLRALNADSPPVGPSPAIAAAIAVAPASPALFPRRFKVSRRTPPGARGVDAMAETPASPISHPCMDNERTPIPPRASPSPPPRPLAPASAAAPSSPSRVPSNTSSSRLPDLSPPSSRSATPSAMIPPGSILASVASRRLNAPPDDANNFDTAAHDSGPTDKPATRRLVTVRPAAAPRHTAARPASVSASLCEIFNSVTFDSPSAAPRALAPSSPIPLFSRSTARRDALLAMPLASAATPSSPKDASPMHIYWIVLFTVSMSANLPAVSTSTAWPDA